ncbi:MAG: guanine deaminase [Rhizobiales bacterium]|nr:guanine deaminase [Hyphomicrobiales bacterium]
MSDTLVELDAAGTIAAVLRPTDPDHAEARRAAERQGRLVVLPTDTFVLPGFVDLHIHAPQYPQLGTALHVPLEVWLQENTFPTEARFADLAFAERAYSALVGDLLALGTTTAVMFASIHGPATRKLVDLCLDKGLRAVIGKTAMDDPRGCPDFYRDASAEAAVAESAALIDYVRSHPANRAGDVLPAVIPRFIPACTDAALEGLGALAAECRCHIQTHCSESDWEHGAVLARYGRTDAKALDGFGLLTRRTVLAHGNFLPDDDMDLIRERGSGVAHCPLSNVYFSNAVFPLRRALVKGLRVGLGTDIAGGPSASLLENIRMAVHASRMLEEGVDADLAPEARGRPGTRIDWKVAFHLATAGGADVLDIPVGTFAPGMKFDAIAIDTAAPDGTIRRLDGDEDLGTTLQRILFTASKRNIADVWTGGRRVAGAA